MREYGVSKVIIYNWRKKYGGMDASEMKRINELEEENQQVNAYVCQSGDGVGRSPKCIIDKCSNALPQKYTDRRLALRTISIREQDI